MNSEGHLQFNAQMEQLERLGQLKDKGLLTEIEFEETRRALVASLLSLISTSVPTKVLAAIATSNDSVTQVPYGDLHDTIVGKIASRSPADAFIAFKEGAYASIARMTEARALNEGDSAELAKLIEEVDSTLKIGAPDSALQDAYGQGTRLLLQFSTNLTRTATWVRTRVGASPAAVAIAETAQQSATTAAQHALSPNTVNQPTETAQSLWRRLVLPDIDGAFEGGCAAVDVAKAFETISPSAIGIPIAAALGVVIGAGIRSGHAYRRKGE
jgi:hypothetical protein